MALHLFYEKLNYYRSKPVLKGRKGVTLIELIILVSIIGIIALLTAPEIGRFRSAYALRSCATDLIQHMRVARAMAIKENRTYLITFDTLNQRYMIGFSSNDNDLFDLNLDTFGICKDTDNDRLPNGDVLLNGIPECVRVVNLRDYGNNISFGTMATRDKDGYPIPAGTLVTFSGTPPSASFNSDGSAGILGTAYFQHITRGYSYAVTISNNAGAMNMFRWDGDKDNPNVTSWTEIR